MGERKTADRVWLAVDLQASEGTSTDALRRELAIHGQAWNDGGHPVILQRVRYKVAVVGGGAFPAEMEHTEFLASPRMAKLGSCDSCPIHETVKIDVSKEAVDSPIEVTAWAEFRYKGQHYQSPGLTIVYKAEPGEPTQQFEMTTVAQRLRAQLGDDDADDIKF